MTLLLALAVVFYAAWCGQFAAERGLSPLVGLALVFVPAFLCALVIEISG